MTPDAKAGISERALIQRINRKLKHDNERLFTARTAQMEVNCGHYYIVDLNKNAIVYMNVDLEELAKELGVAQSWEQKVSTPAEKKVRGLVEIFQLENLSSSKSFAGDLARAIIRLVKAGRPSEEIMVLAAPFMIDLGRFIEAGGKRGDWHPQITEQELRAAVWAHLSIEEATDRQPGWEEAAFQRLFSSIVTSQTDALEPVQ